MGSEMCIRDSNSLSFLFDTVIIGDGSAVLKAVNRDTIHRFFEMMKEE